MACLGKPAPRSRQRRPLRSFDIQEHDHSDMPHRRHLGDTTMAIGRPFDQPIRGTTQSHQSFRTIAVVWATNTPVPHARGLCRTRSITWQDDRPSGRASKPNALTTVTTPSCAPPKVQLEPPIYVGPQTSVFWNAPWYPSSGQCRV